MEIKDKNGIEIKDNNILLLTYEDSVEPTGYNKVATNVKLCYWSDIEERYIPLSELNQEGIIVEGEIIKNSINI